MNQQWMTILLSKGIELEQSLRRSFESVSGQVEGQVKKQLESRGVRLNAADFAALLEEISPKVSRVALSYALDIIRPFSSGMGFRVSNLSDNHIELVVPNRTRNKNEQGQMHEGAMVAAGIEAAKLLWTRHADGDMSVAVESFEVKIHKPTSDELRVLVQLEEPHREVVLAELRDNQNASSNIVATVFDENKQTVAVLSFKLSLHMGLTLGFVKN